MTRDDILRRLAEAMAREDFPPWGPTGRPTQQATAILDALRAIAREPGGAEAVAEAVGIEPICDCDCCDGTRRSVACRAADRPSFGDVCGLLSDDPAVRAAANARCCACHAPPAICSEACQIGLLHHAECSAGKEPTP